MTTVSQPITGLGNLTVESSVGGGAVILDGVSTYLGLTTVRSGALAIGDPNHQSAALAGRGPVIVDAGATFGGYGTVAGSVFNFGTIAAANAMPILTARRTGRSRLAETSSIKGSSISWARGSATFSR